MFIFIVVFADAFAAEIAVGRVRSIEQLQPRHLLCLDRHHHKHSRTAIQRSNECSPQEPIDTLSDDRSPCTLDLTTERANSTVLPAEEAAASRCTKTGHRGLTQATLDGRRETRVLDCPQSVVHRYRL